MSKFLGILVFISLVFSAYNVGEQISINDQQLTKEVCYGHSLTTGDDFNLYGLNGQYNGGDYHVMFLDLSATW